MTADTYKLGFFETLRADMRMMEMHGTSFPYMVYAFFRSPDFLAVLIYRIAAIFVRKGKVGYAVALCFWRLNVLINSCEIDPLAKIGPGFSVPHPVGVQIGPVIIGCNVKILQHVTLGARGGRGQDHSYTGPDSRAKIGNDVVIYAGAVLAGGVKIGNGVDVGANAVVLQDVPDNCLAVGVPARIIERKNQVQ